MINWAIASDLDRVDHHRVSAEWVANLWRADDAKLLKLDEESRFTTNTGGSKLRMTKPFVEYDSQRHRLLGLLNGSPIFAVETLTEGEVHESARGRIPADRQRARHRRHRRSDHPLAPDGAALPEVRWPRPWSSTAGSPGTARSARVTTSRVPIRR